MFITQKSLCIHKLVIIFSCFFFLIPPEISLSNNFNDIYGDKIEYNIFSNDKKIGEQTITFDKIDNYLSVTTSTRIQVKVLFVTVLNLSHTSIEKQENGEVINFDSTTEVNGTVNEISLSKKNNSLFIQSPEGKFIEKIDTLILNLWDMNILIGERFLDPVSGELYNAQVIADGEETINIDDNEHLTDKFTFQGDYDAEVWYDKSGRLVKVSIPGRGGVAEYICANCFN